MLYWAGVIEVGAERQPNRLLASLMDEAGMSNKGLAARVRTLARRDGHPIATDHVSVRRWLDGSIPRGRTPDYIALALSARLERPISLYDIGLEIRVDDYECDDTAAQGLQYQDTLHGAVESLTDLSVKDFEGHRDVQKLQWSSDATADTITKYLFGDPPTSSLSHREPEAPWTAAAIRRTAAHLMDLELTYGGGYVRKLLLFFFRSEVVPLLRQQGSEKVHRDILSAAAEVTQLIGWSAYDSGHHGAAQRYFIQGLRLAREADDSMMGGRLLANLSHQANYLGKFDDAARFARAAQSLTSGRSSHSVAAMFITMEARAQASIGDEHSCASGLNKAETLLAKRTDGGDPEWVRYFDVAELAGEMAHCFRDLRRPAETRMFADSAVESATTPARTRAFLGMVKAAGVLEEGDADEACHLASSTIELAGALQSRRYLRYIADLHRSLATATGHGRLANHFAACSRSIYPEIRLVIP